MDELSHQKMWDAIGTIMEFYSGLGGAEIFDNHRFNEGGDTEMLFPRLHRAAINQLENGSATSSRYGIWAATVRDILVESLQAISTRNPDDARESIRYAINALGAFIDIQAAMDSYQGKDRFYGVSEILESYRQRGNKDLGREPNQMVELLTWAGRSRFSYTGSVKTGIQIRFGQGYNVNISPEEFSKMLTHFEGLTVNIGTSRTDPPKGSLGEWFKLNTGKPAVTSYVGPILIREGYAEKVGKVEIRFNMLR
jgi:hypothetical protein